MEAQTNTPAQTQKIAQKLAQNLKAGDIVALYGDLGSGKTVFVQGLAKGLGIKRRILSPTFVFVRSYQIKRGSQQLIFHHVDLYRAALGDFQTLGLTEIFSPNSIVAIEWAEKIKSSLPKKRIDVFITVLDEKTRRIKIISPSIILFPSVILSEAKDLNEKFSTNSNIKKAASILTTGGVVIFPTDTVYGIGCRFDDQKAIERLYQIKGTPKTQLFPILVSNLSQVEKLAQVTQTARNLIKKYWPGALTIVLPCLSTYSNPGLEYIDKPGLRVNKVGFRMPNSKLILTLIDKIGVPVIGTSANFHGHPTSKTYQDLDPGFVKLADSVIKGKCRFGVESTVVDATSNPIKIIRQGVITL